MVLSPAEWLLLTTIRIETVTLDGLSTGTGFFFNFCIEEDSNKCIPTIVTNKHVIKDGTIGKLRFSIQDSEEQPLWGQHYDVQVQNFEKSWILHPDPSIDLCVLTIASIHNEIAKAQKKLLYTPLDYKFIPDDKSLKEDFSRIEDITIIGYPDGIWDATNNMPIVRKGITATTLQLDFNNQPKFLVDAAIYGGSSGSPVFVFNQGSYALPKGGLIAGNRLKLVGIIHAVALHTVEGDIKIVDIPTSRVPMSTTQIPNNLGIAIHARKLLDFEKILANLIPKE